MKVTIIRDDSVVGIDGVFFTVDLSNLDPSINAIHFNSDHPGHKGNVEFKSETNKTNVWLEELGPYHEYVDRWNEQKAAREAAAADAVRIAAEQEAVRIASAPQAAAIDEARRLKNAAIEALLAQAALDPLAPQEVKDYASAKAT